MRQTILALAALGISLALQSGCTSDDGAGSRPADTATARADSSAGTSDARGDSNTRSDADARPNVDGTPTTDSSTDVGTAPGWQSAPPVGGGPRQEHDVAVLNSKLYVIGGFDAGTNMLSSVEVFDPETETWSTAAPFPEPLHHANVAVVDGTLYVVGYLVGGFREKGDVYAYDPSSDEWRKKTPMPADRARGASAVGAIDGRIYVAGGLRDRSAVSMFSVYDPEADAWSELPDTPRNTDHAAAGVLEGELVVAGGRETQIGNHTNQVDIFDPEKNAWREGNPMPTSRAGVASTVWNGHLIVVGGEGNPAPEADGGLFSQTEAYDANDERWLSLPEMASPRHGMEAAVLGGTLYVPGGGDVMGFGAVETHSKLSLSGRL